MDPRNSGHSYKAENKEGRESRNTEQRPPVSLPLQQERDEERTTNVQFHRISFN